MQRSVYGVQFAIRDVTSETGRPARGGAGVPFYLPEAWPGGEMPWAETLIRDAFEAQWPPFVQAWYGDRFRTCALEADWLARSFIVNADKEATGALSLWKIASECHDYGFAAKVAEHARDEARHARMYLGMLELTFPGALPPDQAADLHHATPVLPDGTPGKTQTRPLKDVVDDLVQINIGEIRTRLHQMLLRPVALAAAPADNRDRLAAILDRIYDDEGRHIIYTAKILDSQEDRDFIGEQYARRLSDFSALTLKEVGVGAFD